MGKLTTMLEEFYGSEYPVAAGVYVDEFVEEKKLDDGQVRALFRSLVEGNSRLPDIKRINDSLKDCIREGRIDLNDAGLAYHNMHADRGLAEGANMTVEQIVARCMRVRASSDPLTTDVDFMHAWDGFYYAYNHLKRIGWEPGRYTPYLNKVKGSVLEGKFQVSTLPETDAERDPVADVKATMERQGKMVEFENLKMLKI